MKITILDKESIRITLVLTLISGLILVGVPEVLASTGEEPYGAENVIEDRTYTLEEMLTYAIQDEYKARAEYELIITEMDGGRPFTNIIKSEETHIALLKPLFEAHDIELPEDDAAEHTVLPENIDVALEVGVQAEIENIAMYENFLSQDLPEDVEEVFLRLKNASQNHLSAFRNASSPEGRGGNRFEDSGRNRGRAKGNEPRRGKGK
ncbi:MAG: hypothetical protein V5A83_05275 [Candidatus Bipolaricaulota bacterium]